MLLQQQQQQVEEAPAVTLGPEEYARHVEVLSVGEGTLERSWPTAGSAAQSSLPSGIWLTAEGSRVKLTGAMDSASFLHTSATNLDALLAIKVRPIAIGSSAPRPSVSLGPQHSSTKY